MQHLQSFLIEKEKREEENLQALAQKASEQIQLQMRCLALQDANETYQEQAKKAVDEKERVQRDYLQVVYDLGKAQKQLNSISKETIAITEKDFLLREIDQLQKENDELQQKMKGSGVSHLSDSQQVTNMQKHIQELEEEMRKLRFSDSTSSSHTNAPPPATPAPMHPSRHPPSSYQPHALMMGNNFPSPQNAVVRDRTSTPTNLMSVVSSLDISNRREPSYQQQPPGGDSSQNSRAERPLTLRGKLPFFIGNSAMRRVWLLCGDVCFRRYHG